MGNVLSEELAAQSHLHGKPVIHNVSQTTFQSVGQNLIKLYTQIMSLQINKITIFNPETAKLT
jgi:hypothetical protein